MRGAELHPGNRDTGARSALYFVSGSLSDTAGVKRYRIDLVCQDVKQAQERESVVPVDSVEHPSLMILHDQGRNSEALEGTKAGGNEGDPITDVRVG